MAAAIASTNAHADQPDSRQRIDVPASRLGRAIAELSRETGVSIGAEGALPDRPTPAIHGRMGTGAALQRLLAGSGWRAVQVGPRAWRIERAPLVQPERTSAVNARSAEAAASPGPAVDNEPIVVTGLKRPSLLESVPISVSVVTLDAADDMRGNSGTSRIAEASEGLSLTGLGPGRNRMFLRGVADSALNGESQSTVAVVLDGLRLTFSAPDPDIRLVDVDRVELLKGPQGALYGSGALGGIYNIVSRAPDLDETRLTGSATVAGSAQGGLEVGGTVVANLPLVQGQSALRLVGYRAAAPGWVDTGGRRDSNRSSVTGGRAALRVGLGEGWEARASGLVQWLETADSHYVYQPGARTRPAQLAEPHDNDLQHAALRLTGQTGLGDLTLQSGLVMHEVNDVLDASVGADSFGLAQPRLLEDERQYRLIDNEARLSGHWGEASWQAGLSWLVARQSQTAVLTDAAGQSHMVDDDHRRTTELALFGDISLPLGGDFTVDAGGRMFRAAVRERRLIGATNVQRSRDRFGLTPSLALSWQPDRGHFAWVRYAAASRPGGSDISPAGDLEQLASDELQSIEAGWRQSLDHGFHVEVSGWWSGWSHIQSDVLLANGLVETVNAGTAQMRGIEALLSGSIASDWHVTLGGSFSDARLTRTTLPFAVDDNSLPVVPRTTLRAQIGRGFAVGAFRIDSALLLRYVGRSHLSFDPRVDRRMGDIVESRFDLMINRGLWTVAVTVENILGQSGNVFAFGNPFRFGTMRQYTPQAPTLATISLMRRL